MLWIPIRFSLRSLLSTMAVLGLAMGAARLLVTPAEWEYQADQELFQTLREKNWVVDSERGKTAEVSPWLAWMMEPSHLVRTSKIRLVMPSDASPEDTQLMQQCLDSLQKFQRLKSLSLDRHPDLDYRSIACLPSLESLSLNGFKDADQFAQLMEGTSKNSHLRELRCTRMKLSDAALFWIGKMDSLESLDLTHDISYSINTPFTCDDLNAGNIEFSASCGI